jgi:hypothetical protein
MTGKDSDKVTQLSQGSEDASEEILAVPEDLESRLPEFKRRYLEYRKQKGWPDLPVEQSVTKE